MLKKNEMLDYYEEAIKVKARERMLIMSPAQDRRTSRYLSKAYNDDTIHCHICFICAEKHVHIGGFIERGEHCGKTSQYKGTICLLYTSPSPRDGLLSRMPSSA